MKLTELLYRVNESTTVWISEDPTTTEGLYFGFAGDMKLRDAKGYEVVKLYPEHYPAIYNFAGITVIVRKENAQ